MKKATKKLNIKKETVAAFTTMSGKEMEAVNGGAFTTTDPLSLKSCTCMYHCGSVVAVEL